MKTAVFAKGQRVVSGVGWLFLGALPVLGYPHPGHCMSTARPSPLVIWDCEGAGGRTGLEVVVAPAKSGKAAVRWGSHLANPSVSVPGVPKDWSGYHELRFWLHNERPVPARIAVIVGSENPSTTGGDYWGYQIALNFLGWRQIVLPIGEKGGTRSPRGWDQVDGLTLRASGWGNEPHPEAEVCLDQFELVVNPPRPGPEIGDAEFFSMLDL
ncbi:MAG: hypothetical protein IT577_24630, partial [Verrucomicrobiae bacterium]|nr:hypothetical protein [Verrucomicrobiae bacterium]